MNRKNIIIILLVLVLVALILFFSLWFDKNWGRQEVIGDHSPSWQEPSTNPPESSPATDPEESSEPENNPQEDEDTSKKVVAPDFSVYNVEGEKVQLSDFIGKPIILNFWASWCGPCKGEMPAFQAKFEEYGDDVHFLMINLTDGEKETAEGAYTFILDQEYTFPVYFDTASEAVSGYGIRSIPTTFFIDAEGYAIAQATGAIDAETLQKGIDLIYTAPEETEENNENPDA